MVFVMIFIHLVVGVICKNGCTQNTNSAIDFFVSGKNGSVHGIVRGDVAELAVKAVREAFDPIEK